VQRKRTFGFFIPGSPPDLPAESPDSSPVTARLIFSRHIDLRLYKRYSVCYWRINGLKKTSKVFKALSDETRLRILKMLEAKPLCVCEIQHVLKGSQPNVSHHLKTLFEAGLVDSRRDGLWIAYRLADKPETPIHAAVLALLRRSLKDDDRVRKDRVAVKTVNRLEIALRK
jgi:ArsR family transcriptional regulator